MKIITLALFILSIFGIFLELLIVESCIIFVNFETSLFEYFSLVKTNSLW